MAAATAAVLKESHRRALEEEMKERPATQEREAMAEAAEQLQRQMTEVFYARNKTAKYSNTKYRSFLL